MIELSVTRRIVTHKDLIVATAAMRAHAQERNLSIVRRLWMVWYVANPGRPLQPASSWAAAMQDVRGPQQ